MYQFEDAKPKTPATPTSSAAEASDGTPDITHRTLLAWGEHCVECAAPACYSTCDLYLATSAGKCRRFEDGIVANRVSGAATAAEVRFRRWGKLEAQGNAALLPAGQVDVAERVLTAVAPIASRVGRGIARVTGQSRWATAMETLHKRINDRLHARGGQGRLPDVFIAEIVNPGSETVDLVLTAMIDKLRLTRALRTDQLPLPMNLTIRATPGFSRHVLPVGGMRDILTCGLPFNLSLTPANGDDVHLIFQRLDLAVLAKASETRESGKAAAPTKSGKLVVFDLDNTLWDGVLLEGDVKLRAGIADLFRTLDERGILISVASKNAHEDAMSKLEALGLAEYVLHPRIGWGPKSEGLAQIIKAIDIGADTVLFIDDNPFERAEVGQAAPEIEVLPDTAIPGLADHPRLQGAVTPESRARRQMYREAIVREQTAQSYGDDYLTFLRDCEIHVEIRRDTPDDFDRIVELVQRTNQLNFSGRKYGREEITAILGEDRDRHVVVCRDKFGTYGTVGFCLSSREAAEEGREVVVVEDFMLSCRVQGKFIEQALFWYLAEGRGKSAASAVVVNFKKTDRNRAAEMVLEKLGFAATESGQLRLDLSPGDLAVDFLTIEE